MYILKEKVKQQPHKNYSRANNNISRRMRQQNTAIPSSEIYKQNARKKSKSSLSFFLSPYTRRFFARASLFARVCLARASLIEKVRFAIRSFIISSLFPYCSRLKIAAEVLLIARMLCSSSSSSLPLFPPLIYTTVALYRGRAYNLLPLSLSLSLSPCLSTRLECQAN